MLRPRQLQQFACSAHGSYIRDSSGISIPPISTLTFDTRQPRDWRGFGRYARTSPLVRQRPSHSTWPGNAQTVDVLGPGGERLPMTTNDATAVGGSDRSAGVVVERGRYVVGSLWLAPDNAEQLAGSTESGWGILSSARGSKMEILAQYRLTPRRERTIPPGGVCKTPKPRVQYLQGMFELLRTNHERYRMWSFA